MRALLDLCVLLNIVMVRGVDMYIDYNATNANGLKLNNTLKKFQELHSELQTLGDLIDAIGAANIEGNPEFGVGAGDGQAFNDSFLQIVDAYVTFFGDGSDGTVREKVSRFVR